MERRRFLLTSLAGALAAPLTADGQQAGKMYRIGFLPFSGCSVPEAFRSALNRRGYVEGRNVVIECRAAAGSNEGLSDAATELTRPKLDVLVAQGTPAARAAQRATATTPVVFITAGDPVANGIVTSLARPGKNVTGMRRWIRFRSSRAEFLKQSAPKIARVAVLLDLSNQNQGLQMNEQDAAARALGLELQRIDIRRPADRAATLVDRILKGANPAEIPVEQPTKFDLVINLKTAKALGLTIPPSLLARDSGDRVSAAAPQGEPPREAGPDGGRWL
jgi:putative ABC transport system substrate-binding protein